jgi:NhaA family Na+:H+ antiporter
MNDKQSAPDLAQPLERRFEELTEPFKRFVSNQISGAILLLAATLVALVFANTSLDSLYLGLEKIEAGFFVQDFELRKTLHHWVNDGLMVLFFFCWGWKSSVNSWLANFVRSASQVRSLWLRQAVWCFRR